jgi:hypothetical protein
MDLRLLTAALCAAVIAVTALADHPAEAATKKKRVITRHTPVVLTTAPRARLTVRARSFLDAGTEVLPGDRKFMDYAIPPGYSPTSVIDNHAGIHRSPLPGPYDLPMRQNPYPWNWCVGC